MTTANEKDHLSTVATIVQSFRNVLVISPYPGDEVFGCGATLSLLHVGGSKITTIIVTNGEMSDVNSEQLRVETLFGESCAASKLLGLDVPVFWGVSNHLIQYGESMIGRLCEIIKKVDPDLIIFPSPTGWKPHHQVIGFAGAEAIRRLGGKRQFAFCEVTDPLPCPNLVHDVSSAYEKKLQAMRCFSSLLVDQSYDTCISGINGFRALQLGNQVKSAEAFTLLTVADLDKGLNTLLEGPLAIRRKLGFTDINVDQPLVSVIIRSVDRLTLSDALDSIALQTYSNVEVVLVNARGIEHQKMQPWCGRFPLRMIGTGESLHRTRAANVGLDAAQGQYLMFLDDDDWIEADHIQKLVSAISRHSDFNVVYTGVKCVDENKEPLNDKFETPFDAAQIVAGNFIPIHAVLFSRCLLELGCRLDESLDLYEDWDFWIQLSRHGNFLKIGGLSAVYRITRKTGFGVNADPVLAERAALVLYKKWIVQLSDQQIIGLMSTVRSNRRNDIQITGFDKFVTEQNVYIDHLVRENARLVQEMVDKNIQIDIQGRQIDQLNQSLHEKNSWIAELEIKICNLDEQVANSSHAATERQGRILFLEQAIVDGGRVIADRDRVTAEKDRLIHEQAHTIASLHGSSSWRVTEPLRYVGRIGRKAKDVRAVVTRLLRRDSIPVLSKKLLGVLRRDGLAGVKSLVRQHHLRATQAPGPSVSMADSALGPLEPVAIVRDLHGHYAMAPNSNGYTYIEPQRPLDLNARIADMKSAPTFSIVVPTYNTPAILLEALLGSVHRQWYPHWKLILVDDASPAEQTRQALTQINHQQIKLLRLEKNQGIAGATNAALDMADGDFIVFLDHDDELTVDCLYELALCIESEQPDYIYSDEDKITARGEYSEPHFKPDWSPDTMMSTMFTCHVSCVRRTLLKKVGGLRSQYDGCQDWDFVLRLSEQTHRISHIPKVLYHWRIIPGSTAADISAKSYILDASQRVREAALLRRGLNATIEPIVQVPGYFRVAYQLQGNPLISIIIPTRDNAEVLRRCVESIRQRTRYNHFELVILDNGSVQPNAVAYLGTLKEMDGITVIRHDAPFNFSELNNIGAQACTGELILFLNDDTEVLQEDWLERLGGFAQLTHVGAVGAKLLYPGNTQIQHAGVLNLEPGPMHAFLRQAGDSPGYYMRNLLEYNWLAVTGACLMVSRDKFNAVKGFSEVLPVAYNDVDLCMRLHDAGFFNVVCQAVRLTHHESASRGLDHIEPEKWARLMRDLAKLYERNPRFFQYDPFHNPNLLSNGINFEVPT
jgi:glycosyltransferase involved in cell wall biosynthesis/LmbE family N-acetylglucosaminyl deacetylase